VVAGNHDRQLRGQVEMVDSFQTERFHFIMAIAQSRQPAEFKLSGTIIRRPLCRWRRCD
jgi:hypothetical protein